tara:strand:+ start:434 stop:628 length:195 start_codon:yes stop_codon:yes gene_type:complete
MKESELYFVCSIISFIAFILCLSYVINNKSLNYEKTVISVLGLYSLAKTVEYYEKSIYKKAINH